MEDGPRKKCSLGNRIVIREIVNPLDGTFGDTEEVADLNSQPASDPEIKSGTKTIWPDEYSKSKSSFSG